MLRGVDMRGDFTTSPNISPHYSPDFTGKNKSQIKKISREKDLWKLSAQKNTIRDPEFTGIITTRTEPVIHSRDR
jgi:hypothetical protein